LVRKTPGRSDTFTREFPTIAVDTSFSGKKVAAALDTLAAHRGVTLHGIDRGSGV
jgi:hypothetical protein